MHGAVIFFGLQVVDPETGGERLDDIRTRHARACLLQHTAGIRVPSLLYECPVCSYGTFLDTAQTSMIRGIEERVATFSQVPQDHQEQLQVLQCAPAALPRPVQLTKKH